MNDVATTDKPASTPAAATPATDDRRGGQQRGGNPQRRRRKMSRYATQMSEKQNLKRIYGIREQQLRRYYETALRSKSETGPQLVTLLESRLDNALFRAGFAPTRPAARQMATHALVSINGRSVSVPSIQLRVGDVVQVKETKRGKPLFENFEMKLKNAALPSWLSLTPGEFSFSVSAVPDPEEAALGVDVRTIVEYFAR